MTAPLHLKTCPACNETYRLELVDKPVILNGRKRTICRGCYFHFAHQLQHDIIPLDLDDIPDPDDAPVELNED